MDDRLRSDELRDLLFADEEDADDPDIYYGSDHESDVNSTDLAAEYEDLVFEEVDDGYEAQENFEEDYGSDGVQEASYVEFNGHLSTGAVHESGNNDGMEVEEINGEGAQGTDNEEGMGVSGQWKVWSEGDNNFNKFLWKHDSGYKPPNDQTPTTPLDFFHLFFTNDLMLEIVKETNRYAAEKIQKNTPLQKKSIWLSWKDLTLEELKAFFGLIINMGMNEKPEIGDYFSNNWVDYQPFFKDVFSKERFLQIFWNLHVSPPPSGRVAGTLTRSGKVRNVAAYLDKKFREYFVPQHEVSVDESMIGFKGRILFKSYNKDKPIKWGIKVFVLSDSTTGYICAIEPYFGKTTTDRLIRPDLGATSRVVLHLVDKLKQTLGDVEGLHVFTDRFYSNLDLAEALLAWKAHTTGTIMLHRKGLPEEVRPARPKKDKAKKQTNKNLPTPKLKLKTGETKIYRKNDEVSLLLWKDKNLVAILSTLFGDNSTQTVRRYKKGGVGELVKKPTAVCEYNKHMGGVDIADQYISSYSFTRKSLKWWRKMFFWLLETAIVNSFILYNTNQERKNVVRQRRYRKMLIKELVGEVRNVRKRGRPSSLVEDERLNGKLHLPYPLEGGKTKDCAVCSDRRPGKERKRSKFFCKTCSNNPGLHMGECFEKYHSVKKIRDD